MSFIGIVFFVFYLGVNFFNILAWSLLNFNGIGFFDTSGMECHETSIETEESS